MPPDQALRRRYDNLPLDELADLVQSGQLAETAQPIAESVLAERRAAVEQQPEVPEPDAGLDPDMPPQDPNNPYSPPQSRLGTGAKGVLPPLRRYYALAGAVSFVIVDLITTPALAYINYGRVRWAAAQLLYRVIAACIAGAIAGLIFRPFEVLVPLPNRPARGAAFFGGVTVAIYIVLALLTDDWPTSWWFLAAAMVVVLGLTGATTGWAVDWLDQRFNREKSPRG